MVIIIYMSACGAADTSMVDEVADNLDSSAVQSTSDIESEAQNNDEMSKNDTEKVKTDVVDTEYY